jgi:hypothetical protein
MLFKVTTTAAFKADRKILPPSNEKVLALIDEALEFSERKLPTLRKYELVAFAAASYDVQNYLEAWRAPSSQVFVTKGQKWQDAAFPARHLAIAPSKEWLSLGLPPEAFVRWYRRSRIRCDALFGHTEKHSKAHGRIVVDGLGAVATGVLKQGTLADLWILNAIAVLLGHHKLLTNLFQATAQEDIGRFCVRLFEGGAWNSVFIDDRIPCTPDGHPIFARSSFSREAWVMLLEKAIAKHLGSYGHIAERCNRPDATEAMLRMLTGGHVTRISTGDFDWKSIIEDVKKEDGTRMVEKLLAEGSVVAFGRSAPQLLGRNTLKRFPTESLIHSRLFPVVGIETILNYKTFVLRDAFGLMEVQSPSAGEADYTCGRQRTFLIKAEDLLSQYDTAYIIRYPDTIRSMTSIYPSFTCFSRHCTSSSENDPAIFRLQVDHSTIAPTVQSAPGTANSSVDGRPGTVDTARTSDSVSSRSKSQKSRRRQSGDESKDGEEPQNQKQVPEVPIFEKPVEFCLTTNSSVEWSKSWGSSLEKDRPETFIVIYPTDETLASLKASSRDLKSINLKRYTNDFSSLPRESAQPAVDNDDITVDSRPSSRKTGDLDDADDETLVSGSTKRIPSSRRASVSLQSNSLTDSRSALRRESAAGSIGLLSGASDALRGSRSKPNSRRSSIGSSGSEDELLRRPSMSNIDAVPSPSEGTSRRPSFTDASPRSRKASLKVIRRMSTADPLDEDDGSIQSRTSKASRDITDRAGSEDDNTDADTSVDEGRTSSRQRTGKRVSIPTVPSIMEQPKKRTKIGDYSLEFHTSRSWKSLTLFLWPGEYFVVTYVRFSRYVDQDDCVERRIQDSSSRPKNKTFWRLPAEEGHRVWCHVSCPEVLDLTPVKVRDQDPLNVRVEVESLKQDFKDYVLSLRPQRPSSAVESAIDTHSGTADSADGEPENEKWPFVVEHQVDTGSNGMIEVLRRLKGEMDRAMAEIFSLRLQREEVNAAQEKQAGHLAALKSVTKEAW